jgi:CO/xanthine dehydrogenase FAD-binding subunit
MISRRKGGFVLREVSYFAPTELDEALKLLAEYGEKVTVLAGGTDLMPKLNHYELKPEAIVYIGGLGLSFINDEGDKLVIGSATTTAMLAKSDIVGKKNRCFGRSGKAKRQHRHSKCCHHRGEYSQCFPGSRRW